MNINKIDKHIEALNRKHRKNVIRKIMTMAMIGIGIGMAGYFIGQRPIVKVPAIVNNLPAYITVSVNNNGLYIQNTRTRSQYHYGEFTTQNSPNRQFSESLFNEDDKIVHDETVLASGYWGEFKDDGTPVFKDIYGPCGQVELPDNLLSANALEDIQKKYCVYHTPEQRLIKAGLKAPKAVTAPVAVDKSRILPDGYTISDIFDAMYWGKDGNFPNNQHPDYVQALRGGKLRAISGPHGSYFTYGTYEDGTYSMHIGVESQFEDTQMELYRLPNGQWRFNCISDDFKDW